MKVIYEAIDGKQFDNEYDCEMYEGKLAHPHLEGITFFTKDCALPIAFKEDIFDDELYNTCEAIWIHSKEELADLQWLTEETGWCEFEQLTEPGFWVRCESESFSLAEAKWIKKDPFK